MFCFYCFDRDDVRESFNGTNAEVYDHWLTKHADNSKPFQFYVFKMLKCCDELHAYPHPMNHHNDKHPHSEFKVDMKYGRNDHGVSVDNVINPIIFTEKELKDLLDIKMTPEIVDESSRKIPKSASFVNVQNSALNLICGFCQKKYDQTEYQEHIDGHRIDVLWQCKNINNGCSHASKDILETRDHRINEHSIGIDPPDNGLSFLRNWLTNMYRHTKIVFKNGLAVEYYNLLETRCEANKLFDHFIETSGEQWRERVRTMELERNRFNVHSNDKIGTSTSSKLNNELNRQLDRINNIFICNMPGEEKSNFPKICKKLQMDVPEEDIDEMFSPTDGCLIVKFKRNAQNIRNNFLDRANKISVYWSDLKENDSNSKQIHIVPDLTVHYNKMWRTAKSYQSGNRIHSFELGIHGMLIKRNRNETGKLCLSYEQIEQYVEERFNH